jgi:glutamate dehydrogenase (NADP+)
MPSTIDATNMFLACKVLFGPGKAANAGGVSVSGLEQSQNAQRYFWTSEEVDQKLHTIMKGIHSKCVEYGKQSDGSVNYVVGANRAGFAKVADAIYSNGTF